MLAERKIPGLVYYPDTAPGITRRRQGRGFSYIAPDGTRIDCPDERARIAALAVPPAYEDVWISPRANGHLQATGRDARRRKQYRYHPDWTEFRAQRKFHHLPAFGEALPAVRRAILRDLKEEAGDRRFAIAAVLALIDRLSLRVGHPAYAKENRSYGATTLRANHVGMKDGEIMLNFTAKGGLKVKRHLKDTTLNRTLARLHDLPGKALVSWLDEDGNAREVTSEEVNTRLAEFTGDETMTAKTFRTWNGSVAALEVALKPEPLTIRAMSEAAAERLHNTPAIARKSYIHPAIIELAELDPDARQEAIGDGAERAGLRKSETRLLSFLSGG
ncbi:DNA topoisomerase IB [Sulfitobacter sp. D35]|uniref:DNA topoisomerase IB n=1 Tax=Sulfitobacter sp. D35 TaxID=3083252 RepID=UPI00296E699D|nr:DNA topoisomerase IB [Sulfitobacter sp. D35]MDW4498204.1 DNA topoisomerase IB [Sulfitobacter sp. D35]